MFKGPCGFVFVFFYYFVAASISRGGWGTLMQEPQRRSVEGEVCVTVPRLACLTVCLSFYVDPSNSNVIIHTCLSVYLFFPWMMHACLCFFSRFSLKLHRASTKPVICLLFLFILCYRPSFRFHRHVLFVLICRANFTLHDCTRLPLLLSKEIVLLLNRSHESYYFRIACVVFLVHIAVTKTLKRCI